MNCLLVIDVQKGLVEKKLYQKELFITTINKAIARYRAHNLPVVFVQHNNNMLQAGTPAWEIAAEIDYQPTDTALQKKHGNAFENTDLKNILQSQGVTGVVVCGLVSHGCVRATILGALAENFQVEVLQNGHTLWNQDAAETIQKFSQEMADKNVHLVES